MGEMSAAEFPRGNLPSGKFVDEDTALIASAHLIQKIPSNQFPAANFFSCLCFSHFPTRNYLQPFCSMKICFSTSANLLHQFLEFASSKTAAASSFCLAGAIFVHILCFSRFAPPISRVCLKQNCCSKFPLSCWSHVRPPLLQ